MTERTRLLLLFVALAAAAALVIASRREENFREVSDGALLEISTIEALHGRQLVGPYSRFGWRHPGPLFFYLEAPWYRASALHTAGMQAGALAINLAAACAIALLLLRSFPKPAAAAIAVAMAAYMIRAGDLLVSVWNPHVIVMPTVAFVLLTAAFALGGGHALLAALVVVGSFLVQTHLALAPLVAALGAVALVARRRDLPRLSIPAAVAAAVVWSPVVVEEITRSPGNVTRIAAFFAGGGPPGQTVRAAVAAWTTELASAVGPRFTVAMGFDFEPGGGWRSAAFALIELAALAAVFVIDYAGGPFPPAARRRGSGQIRWLTGVCLLASIVALASVLRISGRIVDHEVFWISALGALNVAVAAGGILELAVGRAAGWPRAASAAAGLFVAVAVIVGAMGMNSIRHRGRTPDDHAVDVVTDDIQRALTDLRAHRPLFRIDGDIWPIAAGALLQMDKHRQPFAVDEPWVNVFGDQFRANGREDAVITIAGSSAAPTVSGIR